MVLGWALAITATLVHAYGGRLTFQSEPGQGHMCARYPAYVDSTLAAAADAVLSEVAYDTHIGFPTPCFCL